MSELYHHGILGQKWGKKNGPPYPLDASDHSAREKKAGWRRSLSKDKSDSNDKEGFSLSDKQKNYIKIGAGVVATIGIGALVYKTGAYSKFVDIGKQYTNKIFRNGADISSRASSVLEDSVSKLYNKKAALNISKQTGFKVKAKPGTLSENLKVNRGMYKGGPTDPLRNNCSHSSVAWILNEIGLDVKAKPMPSEFIDGGMTSFEIKRFFKGASYKSYTPTGKTVESVRSELGKKILDATNGKDGAGIFAVPGLSGAGHFMGYKVESGKVILVNPQIESDDVNRWLKIIASGQMGGSAQVDVFSRLDNLPINPKYIIDACENA